MKRYGGIALFFFTLLLMSVLSILQGTNAREKLAMTGSLPSGSAPVSCAPADVPCLALTFDLDPGADNVPTLLSILKEHHVKATFFVTGQWLSSHQSEAKAIADGGHELGNHTENHPDMTSLNEKDQTEELALLHSEVLQLTGVSMTLFRPPYDRWDNSVIQNASKNGYRTIGWSIDCLDWKDYSASDIVSSVCEDDSLQNGSIILLHGGARHTADALAPMITSLRENGYQFSTVSRLLESR